ncbi:BppU family phage baseplate upper protein [Enterococcus casseliflavus]|uniref:BppU family phage baseplate upper protein n=1 Tax=Enterococcus casseliflavus TaxID=37734 RepID=UPI002DB80381|nr:BppU family phage baseplate upper protein [Enterococcus casseliflavus]MEB6147399.1 phage baseplate upper protein [Enterococcus casseliflavus]
MENLYVTSEITLNKTAEKRSSPVPTNTEFFSYDQRVAKKTINFQFKGEPLDLSEANVILGFDFVTAGQSVIFESADESIVIEDPAAGKVNVMLPNDIYAYSGSVIIYVFVEFSNGQSLDYPAFSTEFQESWIDQDLEEMAQFYVKRFEDLRNLVLEQASGIDHDLTEFENRIEQIESDLAAFDIDSLAKEIEEEIRKTVEGRLSDIEKRLEAADFVTEENVDQSLEKFMFGVPLVREPLLDLTGKIRASFVENVHRAGGVLTTSLPSSAAGGTEITQAQYNRIATNDGLDTSISSSTANGRMQVVFTWDILGDMKRRFPELFTFFSPKTVQEELAVIQPFVKNIQFTAFAHINSNTSYPIIGYRRMPDNTGFNWEEMASHESTFNDQLTFPIELITNPAIPAHVGKAAVVLRGPERQATNQSAIRVAYAKVDYTLAFSLDKLFIPKTINQMSNPTIDMFNHLAQRVNELEMKG